MDIPNYTLIRKLGEGAMAEVWLAEHKRNQRRVAVKILKRSAVLEDGQVERLFQREGQVLASFHDRNIVTIHDNDRIGDCAFLVMELLSGGTLLERMQRGPIAVGAAIGFVVQIASALSAAHRIGVIHRDLKPANVMLRDETTPVLTDFGAVRVLGRSTIYGRDGAIIGTPCYMSPEQITARPLDGRSDLYALGVLFFELLTGQPPFIGQSMEEIGMQHLHAPVPRLPPELSVLQPILDRMLAKQPEQRFADLDAFVEALRRCFLAEDALRRLIRFDPSSAWSSQLRALGFVLDGEQKAEVRMAQGRFLETQAVGAVTQPVDAEAASQLRTSPPAAAVGDRAQSARRAVPRAVWMGAAVVLLSVTGWQLWQLVVPARAPAAGSVFRDALASGGKGPEVVALPAASLQIGAVPGDADATPAESPPYAANLGAFAIGRYEVSVGEFGRFVERAQYRTEAERNVLNTGCWGPTLPGQNWAWLGNVDWQRPGFPQTARFPVVCVSYNDALAYAEWLSEQTGQRYRLPSESEHEYAVRAGSSSIYPWGNDYAAICDYANGADLSGGPAAPGTPPMANCSDGTTGVGERGRLKANAFGLYDTLGNVWEWNQDCWVETLAGAPAGGQPRVDGNCGLRALRGGSWIDFVGLLRSSYRFRAQVTDRMTTVGFRIVREL